jgi:hypothetical protein
MDGTADSEDERTNGTFTKRTTKGRIEKKKSNGRKKIVLSENEETSLSEMSNAPDTDLNDKKKSNERRKVVLSEDEETSLSEFSDSLDTGANSPVDNSDTDKVLTLPPRRGHQRVKNTSPQVIVSPAKAVTPSTLSKNTRAAKKSTPVRSPYFDHGAASSEVEDEGDSDDNVEVVKPRQTTARTRSKK